MPPAMSPVDAISPASSLSESNHDIRKPSRRGNVHVTASSSSSSTDSTTSSSRDHKSRARRSKRQKSIKLKQVSSRDVLIEAASSFRDVATDTLTGLKEWAVHSTKSPPIQPVSSASSVTSESPDSLKNKRRGRRDLLKKTPSASDVFVEAASSFKEVATDTLTTVKEWATTLPDDDSFVQEHAENEEQRARDFEKKSSLLRLSLVQDLLPFLSCGATTDVDDSVVTERRAPPPVRPPTPSYTMPTSSNKKNAAWNNWNPIIAALGEQQRASSFDESILTFDTQAEEEMSQIRRMTSWGTMGTGMTMLTQETGRTYDTTADQTTGFEAVQDDFGQVIPPVLLKAKKRREESKQHRKRLVKFDYPPISSLRECPRANPDDLPNLFFTEEELDQIEDDRYSTKVADDVEIVAVASLKSRDSSLSDDRDLYTSPNTSSQLSGASFSKYTSTPKQQNKSIPRSRSPFPRRKPAVPEVEPDRRKMALKKAKPSVGSSSKSSATSSRQEEEESPRLIKGVQIFLRERSTG